jgi:hypothetical protein
MLKKIILSLCLYVTSFVCHAQLNAAQQEKQRKKV